MKRRYTLLLILTLLTLVLAGCKKSATESTQISPDADTVTVGRRLVVDNKAIDSRFTLRDNNDSLAANGLYYATWSIGDGSDYINDDGEEATLYDAHLYLLMGESKTDVDAQKKKESWLSAAHDNYQISEEREETVGGHPYTIITYQCGESSPYARGVSAFCSVGDCTTCIELTCQDSFSDDLEPMLFDFLEKCTYVED